MPFHKISLNSLKFSSTFVPSNNDEYAKVAELVDALDLGSSAFGCGGSTPPFRTITQHGPIIASCGTPRNKVPSTIQDA